MWCNDGSGGQRVQSIHSHCEAPSPHSQQEMGEKFGITKTPTGNCKKTLDYLLEILGLVSAKIQLFSGI